MIQLAAAAVLSWLALAGPTGSLPLDGGGPAVRARRAAALAPLASRAAFLPAQADSPDCPLRAGDGAASPRVQEDRWFAQDKLLHFTASFGGFNLAYGALRTAQLGRAPAMVGAAAVAGAAGLWKEWRDRRRGGPFSARDLVWDGLGIVAGLAVAANTR
jgi:uncharacterized protein YfiM (DUF2279 family)